MSTRTVRNEAADRLRSWMLLFTPSSHMLDEALAEERRATVERIRERLDSPPRLRLIEEVYAILDEEAAR